MFELLFDCVMKRLVSSKRFRTLIFVMGIGIPFLGACQTLGRIPTVGNALKLRAFESSEFAFTIDYPETWFATELPDGNRGDKEVVAMFFTLAPFPGASVQQKELSNPTVENVADWGTERISDRYDEHEIGDLLEANVAGQEALERTYRVNMTTGSDLTLRDVYLLNGSQGVILTFYSYTDRFEELNPTFQAMIDSFQIKKS